MLEVMISSTVTDMLPDRESIGAVIDTIPFASAIGAKPIAQAPMSRSPFMATVEMAERCHLYVLLLGGRYGEQQKGGKSATELEFDAATRVDPTKVVVFKKELPDREDLQKSFVSKVGRYFPGY